MAAESLLTSTIDGDRLALAASGSWTAARARDLEPLVDAVPRRHRSIKTVEIDMTGVERLDTFGAWLLERLVRSWSGRGCSTRVIGLPDHYRGLIEEMHQVNRNAAPPSARPAPGTASLDAIGRSVGGAGRDLVLIVQMLGQVASAALAAFFGPKRMRMTSVVHHLDRVAWQAVPIVLLITFLIGAIIAQQGIFHFRKFGVDVYVVDMVGILVLREIGVLIVAIMVAGRSGSAYTAELGSMKMREEIDALRTMGFNPIDILVLPRITALVIGLPLLTFIGSMAALYGGGLVCWLYGGMNPDIFISRLREAISLDHFIVGLVKAPFMALVIGLVASAEGLQTKGSSESLGLQTTASVVKSVFLVIVLDGIFAIFFGAIGK